MVQHPTGLESSAKQNLKPCTVYFCKVMAPSSSLYSGNDPPDYILAHMYQATHWHIQTQIILAPTYHATH